MNTMLKSQMTTYFKKIDKVANIIRIVLVWSFLLGLFAFSKKLINVSTIELFLSVAVLYLLVSNQANNLKQKAIVRHLTDATENNQ